MLTTSYEWWNLVEEAANSSVISKKIMDLGNERRYVDCLDNTQTAGVELCHV